MKALKKEPISTSEVIGGIRAGITPDKPGMYFNFFKDTLKRAEEDIKNYRLMMQSKYSLTRPEYLLITPTGAESELAYELGNRYTRLCDLAHRHLIRQDLLVPKEEQEKYRGYSEYLGLPRRIPE